MIFRPSFGSGPEDTVFMVISKYHFLCLIPVHTPYSLANIIFPDSSSAVIFLLYDTLCLSYWTSHLFILTLFSTETKDTTINIKWENMESSFSVPAQIMFHIFFHGSTLW